MTTFTRTICEECEMTNQISYLSEDNTIEVEHIECGCVTFDMAELELVPVTIEKLNCCYCNRLVQENVTFDSKWEAYDAESNVLCTNCYEYDQRNGGVL